MPRTIRTERDAYTALAQSAQIAAQDRADWRAVLADRDSSRAARRRDTLQRQHLRAARLAALIGAVLAVAPAFAALIA